MDISLRGSIYKATSDITEWVYSPTIVENIHSNTYPQDIGGNITWKWQAGSFDLSSVNYKPFDLSTNDLN